MAKKMEVYKCETCGNIVEVLHGGEGDLVCCGENMKLLEASTQDQGKEKHVPVVEKVDGGYKVTVGETLHPMEEEHHIEWIELIAGDKVYRQDLKAGQTPEAVFQTDAGQATAREHCNVHGLWKA